MATYGLLIPYDEAGPQGLARSSRILNEEHDDEIGDAEAKSNTNHGKQILSTCLQTNQRKEKLVDMFDAKHGKGIRAGSDLELTCMMLSRALFVNSCSIGHASYHNSSCPLVGSWHHQHLYHYLCSPAHVK